MIRIRFALSPGAQHEYQDDEFAGLFKRQASLGFAGVPTGAVEVERRDGRGRLLWKGYYSHYAVLAEVVGDLSRRAEDQR